MLLQENVFAYFKFHGHSQDFHGTCPFAISPKNESVFLKSRGWLRYERLKIFLHFFACLVLSVQLFHARNSVPLVMFLEGLLCTLGGWIFNYIKSVVFCRRKYIVELFNLFIQFEKRLLKGKKYHVNFILVSSVILLYLLHLFYRIYPFFNTFQHI